MDILLLGVITVASAIWWRHLAGLLDNRLRATLLVSCVVGGMFAAITLGIIVATGVPANCPVSHQRYYATMSVVAFIVSSLLFGTVKASRP